MKGTKKCDLDHHFKLGDANNSNHAGGQNEHQIFGEKYNCEAE